MLDVTKYEYIEVDMPNVVIAWERTKDKTNYSFSIDSDIKELVIQAAIKFPMWKFASSHNRRNETDGKKVIEGHRFNVYEDREKIGELSTEYSRAHGKMYCVSNERIRNERERGSYAKTKDLKKAIKILAKQFGAKTINERLTEAHGACNNALYTVYRTKTTDFEEKYKALIGKLTHHLMNNWEFTLSMAKANNVSEEILSMLPSAYEDYSIAKEIQKCYELNTGAVVTIHGKDYAVKEQDCVTIYGTENLPEWLKRGVGMLKLVERNTLIGKVGFKINDTSFFVVKGTTNE